MIAIGIILMILGFILLVFACKDKFENGIVALVGWFSGFVIVIGLNCLLPPFKLQKCEDINIETKQIPEVKKEIFIDTKGKADTTYYYMFTNSSVVRSVD